MSEFEYENMRYILSPLEVLAEMTMDTDGLMRARILDPERETFSVVGYDFMYNKEGVAIPTETDRLKVVELAIGEATFDLTVALLLDDDLQEQISQITEQTRRMRAEFREQRRASELEMEQEVLESKKHAERIKIIQEASLSPDAIDLIRRTVMAEHPDLHFPDQETTHD